MLQKHFIFPSRLIFPLSQNLKRQLFRFHFRLVVTDRTLEGKHTRFLRQITRKQAWRNAYRIWITTKAEVVWEAAGTQVEMTYIRRRQGTLTQWVVLHMIFKICARDTGYEGGGRIRDT